MGISWNTVGDIINRVLWDVAPNYEERFDNLVNIGIDETSQKKGHNYITTVVNNDDSTVIWVAEGHNQKTLSKFFEYLNPEQRASIKTVSEDGARWIKACLDKYIPEAKGVLTLFIQLDGHKLLQMMLEKLLVKELGENLQKSKEFLLKEVEVVLKKKMK